jgi:thiol-disulfide isomerase/thioredoxin
MAEETWYTEQDVDRAFETARQHRKPVFVDFWSPGCKGCEKMEAVTYASAWVREFLAESFVVVKFDTSARSAEAKKLSGAAPLLWTPTLLVLDHEGREVRRAVGYLPPQDFAGELELGLGLAALYHSRPGDALERFKRLARGHANAEIASEAAYWAGVAAYRKGGRDIDGLRVEWGVLSAKFAGSPWHARADVFEVPALVAR